LLYHNQFVAGADEFWSRCVMDVKNAAELIE